MLLADARADVKTYFIHDIPCASMLFSIIAQITFAIAQFNETMKFLLCEMCIFDRNLQNGQENNNNWARSTAAEKRKKHNPK